MLGPKVSGFAIVRALGIIQLILVIGIFVVPIFPLPGCHSEGCGAFSVLSFLGPNTPTISYIVAFIEFVLVGVPSLLIIRSSSLHHRGILCLECCLAGFDSLVVAFAGIYLGWGLYLVPGACLMLLASLMLGLSFVIS